MATSDSANAPTSADSDSTNAKPWINQLEDSIKSGNDEAIDRLLQGMIAQHDASGCPSVSLKRFLESCRTDTQKHCIAVLEERREFLESAQKSRGTSRCESLLSVLRSRKEAYRENLDWLWATAEDLDTAKGARFNRINLVRELFDMSNSPSMMNTMPEARRETGSDFTQPHTTSVDHDVFVTEPADKPAGTERTHELHHFAAGIARDSRVNGVYCLCGVRGSGKSFTLDYIAKECQRYTVKDKRTPLTVRLSVGMAFESSRFITSLLLEICTQATHQLRDRFRPRWLSRTRTWLAHTIHFLNVNLRLIFQAILLIAFVLAVAEGTPVTANEQHGADQLRAELVLVLAGLMGLAIGGLAYFPFKKTGGSDSSEITPRSRLVAQGIALIACAVATLVLAAYPAPESDTAEVKSGLANTSKSGRKESDNSEQSDTQPNQNAAQSPVAAESSSGNSKKAEDTDNKEKSGNNVQNASILANLFSDLNRALPPLKTERWVVYVSTILISCVIWGTPSWWPTFIECWALKGRLDNSRKVRGHELPLPTQYGSFLTLLFPQGTSETDLSELDTPFLLDQAGRLLHSCERGFGRVVILIDDVDMLSGGQFPDLFRILRVTTKVENTCTLVATPMFFLDVYRSRAMNDLHSTVRDCLLLGDRQVYDEYGNIRLVSDRPSLDDNTKRKFRTWLERCVEKRLHYGIRNPEVDKPLLATAWLVNHWFAWHDSDPDGFLATFNKVGMSRREIMRHTWRLVFNRDTSDCELAVDHYRRHIEETEVLNADPVYHHAAQEALEQLVTAGIGPDSMHDESEVEETSPGSIPAFVTSPTSAKYHRLSCRLAPTVSKYPVTPEQAVEQNKLPCRICRPPGPQADHPSVGERETRTQTG